MGPNECRLLSDTRTSEPAASALCFGQFLLDPEFAPVDLRDDHLRDAVVMADGEVLLAEVHQDDLDLAAVIGVDGTGRVGDGNALYGQATAGAHLRLMPFRKFHGKTRGDHDDLHGMDDNIIAQARVEVGAGAVGRLVFRGKGVRVQLLDLDRQVNLHFISPSPMMISSRDLFGTLRTVASLR